jgi:hypothetical protein
MFSYSNKYSEVEVRNSPSAYGEIMTVGITPVLQADFNYGVNGEIFQTGSLSGSITGENSNIIVQCSGSAGSFAEIKTRKLLRYRPGQGNGVRFTALFTKNSTGTKQLYGIGDSDDGYFVGFNGPNFGIMRRSFGVEHWTYQQDFTNDKLDGSAGSEFIYDATKGNIFDLQYQWLGYGAITFNIQNPKTGLLIPFHQIKYSNTSTVPSTQFGSNPILLRVETLQETSTPPVLKGASLFGYLEGQLVYTGPKFGSSGTKIGIGTTQTNLLTLKNESTYKGKVNKISIKL